MGESQSTQGLLVIGRSWGNGGDHEGFAVTCQRLGQNVGQKRVSVGDKVILLFLSVLCQSFDDNAEVCQTFVDVIGLS